MKHCVDSAVEAAAVPASRLAGRGGIRLGAPDPTVQAERAGLVRAIETEIIPRLLLGQRKLATVDQSGAVDAHANVVELANCVLTSNFSVAAARIAGMRPDGVSLDYLCVELLGPAARLLGQMWEEDRLDFAEVTIGLWRLQQLLREFSANASGDACRKSRGLRILLLPACGEQHRFGLSIVIEYFRREGWDVHGGPVASHAELRDLVRDDWFDVVGFSVGGMTRLKPLAGWIRTVRKVSRNPGIGVMVGGKLVAERPELVAQLGADATASDGRQAPQAAERLLALLSHSTAA